MAELIGGHFTAISDWERGKPLPRLDTLERIADALGHDLVVMLVPRDS